MNQEQAGKLEHPRQDPELPSPSLHQSVEQTRQAPPASQTLVPASTSLPARTTMDSPLAHLLGQASGFNPQLLATLSALAGASGLPSLAAATQTAAAQAAATQAASAVRTIGQEELTRVISMLCQATGMTPTLLYHALGATLNAGHPPATATVAGPAAANSNGLGAVPKANEDGRNGGAMVEANQASNVQPSAPGPAGAPVSPSTQSDEKASSAEKKQRREAPLWYQEGSPGLRLGIGEEGGGAWVQPTPGGAAVFVPQMIAGQTAAEKKEEGNTHLMEGKETKTEGASSGTEAMVVAVTKSEAIAAPATPAAALPPLVPKLTPPPSSEGGEGASGKMEDDGLQRRLELEAFWRQVHSHGIVSPKTSSAGIDDSLRGEDSSGAGMKRKGPEDLVREAFEASMAARVSASGLSSKRAPCGEPQALAARARREKINARMRTLQSLVPGASAMTTESFLLEAVHYTKFLQQQIQELTEPGVHKRAPEAEHVLVAYEQNEDKHAGDFDKHRDGQRDLPYRGLCLVQVKVLYPVVGEGGYLDRVLAKQELGENGRTVPSEVE